MKKGRLNKMLEMPEELYTNTPKLTITGFNEIVLENYKGILEYEEFFASISTYIGIVNINGFNINLEKMTGFSRISQIVCYNAWDFIGGIILH